MKRTLLAVLLALLLPASVGAETKIINMSQSGNAVTGDGSYSGDLTVGDDATVTGTVTATDGLVVGETLGPELVANPGCDVAGSWTLGTGWSVGSGVCTHAAGAASSLQPNPAITTVAGTTYKIVWTITSYSASTALQWLNTTATYQVSAAYSSPTTGTITTYFTAGQAAPLVLNANTGVVASVDNVSVRAVTSTITPGSGLIAIKSTLADAAANEVGVSIVGKQTGAGGNKTALRVEGVGSGTGNEYIQEWFADGVSIGSVTAFATSFPSAQISGQYFAATRTASATAYAYAHTGTLTSWGSIFRSSANIGAMNGTDTVNIFDAALTDGAITGSDNYVNAFNAGNYTSPDAQAIHTAVNVGTGWDRALYATNANTAGSGYDQVTLAPVLGIMDGTDTINLLNIAPTNADHTGSTNSVNGVNVAAITGDAQAVETALYVGTGWETALNVGTGIISSTGTSVKLQPPAGYGVESNVSGAAAINLQNNADYTGTALVKVGQNSTATNEFTATNIIQDVLVLKPEMLQTSTAGYNGLHILIGEPSPYTGGGGSGDQNLVLAETAHEDFSSPAEKFKVSRSGEMTHNATIKKLAFSKTPLTNNSATDIFTITLAAGESVAGRVGYGLVSTGGTSDIQVHSGGLYFVCANKGGTFVTDINEDYTNAADTYAETDAGSTFADLWDMKVGNFCTLTLNMNSSLTSAVNTVSGEIVLYGVKPITLN